MVLTLLIIEFLLSACLIISILHNVELEKRLEKEIKHSLALEETINDYIKK